MKISIEYCMQWNYAPKALRARDIIASKTGDDTEIELIEGSGGVFEIMVDGELKFSKKALKRFPEDAELNAIVE